MKLIENVISCDKIYDLEKKLNTKRKSVKISDLEEKHLIDFFLIYFELKYMVSTLMTAISKKTYKMHKKTMSPFHH